MKGIDCTQRITKEMGLKLKKQGIDFVCRYLVPSYMPNKRLVKEEAQDITDAGLSILSVFESTADRAKVGASGGTADGKLAYAETKLVGQPKDSCVYFAVDFEALGIDFNAIEAYLRAAKVELPGYKIGVYGSYAVVEEMFKRKACDCFWQTYAWSGGKVSVHNNCFQYHNGENVLGFDNDADSANSLVGFWNLKPAPVVKPVITPVVKPVVQPVIQTIEQLVDSAITDGLVTDKNYWVEVLKGTQVPNKDYIKTILERATTKIK